MKPILEIRNISKKYKLGSRAPRYSSLRETLSNIFKPAQRSQEFWALKDLSFTIDKGETLGIIGRNGAGKSTFLKILSKITPPTSGKIIARGRIASLLEVGTGFHPELTGRENIFLNGSILGLRKKEIEKKFDEIIDFSEVDKFIDTPLKHYSSGMQLRLAFAVAANLEPEILVIDEVLAVGDAAFQQKCLGKMKDVTQAGRTVLFVSHNMATIINLCKKTLILNKGEMLGFGKTEEMVSEYLSIGMAYSSEVINIEPAKPHRKLRLEKVRISNSNGDLKNEFDLRERINLEIFFQVIIPGKNYNIRFELYHLHYGCVFVSSSFDYDVEAQREYLWKQGNYKFSIQLPNKLLRGGEYYIKVSSAVPTLEELDSFPEDLYFRLIDTDSPVAKTTEGRGGAVMPILKWNM